MLMNILNIKNFNINNCQIITINIYIYYLSSHEKFYVKNINQYIIMILKCNKIKPFKNYMKQYIL